MKKTIMLFLLLCSINLPTHAQQLTHEQIGQFMTSGSMTVKTIQKDTIREIAHSLEFPKYLMAWLPGKDFGHPVNGSFELSSAYVPTSDEKNNYIVLMIPGNMNNMNIRVDKLEKNVLKGELLIAEYMFYDPNDPPKIPPPTYVHIYKDSGRLKYMFNKEKLKGSSWEIVKVEGCSLPMPFMFTLQDGGEANAKAKGEDMYMTWDLSNAGGYIFLEPGDFSERIVGIKTDEQTIEAYSDMSRCRFLIKRT